MVRGVKRSIESYFRPSFYIVPMSIAYLACRAEAHHSTKPSTCSDLFWNFLMHSKKSAYIFCVFEDL